jgi:hypothetical protein
MGKIRAAFHVDGSDGQYNCRAVKSLAAADDRELGKLDCISR